MVSILNRSLYAFHHSKVNTEFTNGHGRSIPKSTLPSSIFAYYYRICDSRLYDLGTYFMEYSCFSMVVGGCAGSTSGCLKDIRLVVLAKIIRNEFKHLIHPNAVLPIRVNKQVISPSVKNSVLAFTFLYILVLVVGQLIMMLLGVGFIDS